MMSTEQPTPDLTTRFVIAIGHDLHSAQAVIKGPVSTLIDYRQRLPDDETNHFLQMIDVQVDRLSALLDDLTELARLQAGQLTLYFEPLRITEVIEQALSVIQRQSPDAVVHFTGQTTVRVDVDEVYLRQILVSLIQAALARSAADAPVRIAVAASEPASITVSVQDLADRQPLVDEAVAILDAPEQLARYARVPLRLWAPLVLKLTLIRALVERHGGRLWTAPGDDPNASQGNTIFLSLPLAKRDHVTEGTWQRC